MKLVATKDALYIIYNDGASILVKKLSGSTWNTVTTLGSIGSTFDADVNDDTIYIATTLASDKGAALYKLSGSSLQKLGTYFPATSYCGQPSLAFDGSTIYAAVRNASGNKIEGYKYDGSSFTKVTDGSITGASYDIAALNGRFYIMTDNSSSGIANSDAITVYEYKDSAWTNYSVDNSSASEVMAISSGSKIYISAASMATSGRSKVYCFNPSDSSLTKEGLDVDGPACNMSITSSGSKLYVGYMTTSDNLVKVRERSIKSTNTNRYDGDDRYDTSLSIAKAINAALGSVKFDTILVACGDNFADALAGSYLAKVKNAPLLIVNSSTEDKIISFINDNLRADGRVYILGGKGVISQGFENKLKTPVLTESGKKTAYNVIRLYGTTRYYTNIAILKAAGVTNEDLLVCSGSSYADSLSASAVGKPILLVGDKITKSQQEYLEQLTGKTVYLIGGTGAVNTTVESQFKKSSKAYKIMRIAGKDRYETSTKVASHFFGYDINSVVLACGTNFPDGLSGGPLALTKGSPLVLIAPSNRAYAQKYIQGTTASDFYILGGVGVIPESLVESIIGSK